MGKINVKEAVKKDYLNEVSHGDNEVKVAYLDPSDYSTITPFFRCKDYFNGIWWSKITSKKINQHGFIWDKDNKRYSDVLDLEKQHLAVKLYNRYSRLDKTLEKNILPAYRDLLWKFEDALGFNRSVITIDHTGKYLLIRFDKGWTKIPYVNSAFHMILRLAFTWVPGSDFFEFYKESKNFLSAYDAAYINQAKDKIKMLLQGRVDSSQKYEDYSADGIESCSGLVSYKLKD